MATPYHGGAAGRPPARRVLAVVASSPTGRILKPPAMPGDCLLAFALLMSPILVLIWLARQLLQDSIVLYAVALIVVFHWLCVCETLLVRFGLVRMALAISPAFHAPCGVLRRPGEYPLPVFGRLIWREAFVCRSPVGCER